MRYLFFDIECANCFNGQGKICSFGYCLVDENFNIIKQEDLIINPESNFCLPKLKQGERGLVFAYTVKQFRRSPDFRVYYEKIRDLLTAQDQIVFGHAVSNDISFLQATIARYKLKPFDIKAYDSQILHRMVAKKKKDESLETLANLYEIKIENLHRSDHDAYLTMRVVEAMCKEKNINVDTLLQMYPTAYVELKDNIFSKKYDIRPLTNILYSHYKKIARGIKFIFDSNKTTYGIDSEFIENEYEKSKIIIDYIIKNDGVFSKRPKNMKYYFMVNKDSDMSKRVLEKISEGVEIEILSLDELVSLLKIPKEEFEKLDAS